MEGSRAARAHYGGASVQLLSGTVLVLGDIGGEGAPQERQGRGQPEQRELVQPAPQPLQPSLLPEHTCCVCHVSAAGNCMGMLGVKGPPSSARGMGSQNNEDSSSKCHSNCGHVSFQSRARSCICHMFCFFWAPSPYPPTNSYPYPLVVIDRGSIRIGCHQLVPKSTQWSMSCCQNQSRGRIFFASLKLQGSLELPVQRAFAWLCPCPGEA